MFKGICSSVFSPKLLKKSVFSKNLFSPAGPWRSLIDFKKKGEFSKVGSLNLLKASFHMENTEKRFFFASPKAEPEGDRREPKGEFMFKGICSSVFSPKL